MVPDIKIIGTRMSSERNFMISSRPVTVGMSLSVMSRS